MKEEVTLSTTALSCARFDCKLYNGSRYFACLQVLVALGKLWHVQHFTCAHCKRDLGTSVFYERDGLAYCVDDYQNLFLPKCADCGGAILEVLHDQQSFILNIIITNVLCYLFNYIIFVIFL